LFLFCPVGLNLTFYPDFTILNELYVLRFFAKYQELIGGPTML